MQNIARLHLRLAVAYVILGMALGRHMGMSEDHSQLTTHAHLNLVGWVSTALFALVLRSYPERRLPTLGWIQIAVWHLAVVVTIAGLFLIFAGSPEAGEPFAIAGSLLALLGMILFAVILYLLTA